MTASRVRVRQVAVALATAACLFAGTLPALGKDKKSTPLGEDQAQGQTQAPQTDTQSQSTTPATETPATGGGSKKQGNGRQRTSGSTGDVTTKDKKPEEPTSSRGGSQNLSGTSQGTTTAPTTQTAQPATPAPAPAAPAPQAGDQSSSTADSPRRSSRRQSARRNAAGGTAIDLDTSSPLLAPLSLVGPAGDERADRSGGRDSDRGSDADGGSRADDGRNFPPVTQTVREIVEVVPWPVKAAFVALALVALLFAIHSLMTGSRARRLQRQREQLLDEVGLLQQALLPAVPSRLGDLVSTVAYRPAEGPAAGGDFYDAFAFDAGRVGVIVGDVSGHGRDALARTALMRYTLRAYLDAGLAPRAALKVAGSVLDDDLGNEFATVVVAVYDPGSGTLTYASAGHPPPILLGPPAHEPVTACSSPPIGAGATTGLRQTTLALPEGSIACFFTDGMTDARVGDQFLGRDRLEEILRELGPTAAAPDLLARVAEIADRTPDDMAACILHAKGAPGGRLRVEELEVSRADLAGNSVPRFLRECGIPTAEVAEVLRTALDTAREAGSAVLRVRLGDWSPGVDVLPGNVETLARASRRNAGVAQTS